MFRLRRRLHDAAVPIAVDREPTVLVRDAELRQRVRIRGQVLGVRVRPSDTLPTFVVRLGDDSGSINLIWTGRRGIGGVSLGRFLVAEGTLVSSPDGPCIYNPEYALEA